MSGPTTRWRVRPPAVAGTFYPADPGALTALLDRCFADARPPAGWPSDPAAVPKALVVPHAGLVYSGPIAASAYARLAAGRDTVRRVVLIGPSHRVPLRGMAVPTVDAFATPVGELAVDGELRTIALAVPGVVADDTPHAWEHCLEVQLPFLLRVLGDRISILPVVTGPVPIDDVAALLDAVWGGPETLVVISTDLSHYRRYADAAIQDRRTATAVVGRRAGAVGDDDACGAPGLRGLLAGALERDLPVELVDLRSSGDTAGDRDRVVGYGAFVVG